MDYTKLEEKYFLKTFETLVKIPKTGYKNIERTAEDLEDTEFNTIKELNTLEEAIEELKKYKSYFKKYDKRYATLKEYFIEIEYYKDSEFYSSDLHFADIEIL